MLIAEYDYDMDIKVQREEAKEEGIEEGIEKGIEQGKKLGKQNDIIELLDDIGEVSEALKAKIRKEENRDILKKWLKLAAKAETVEEFEKKIENALRKSLEKAKKDDVILSFGSLSFLGEIVKALDTIRSEV